MKVYRSYNNSERNLAVCPFLLCCWSVLLTLIQLLNAPKDENIIIIIIMFHKIAAVALFASIAVAQIPGLPECAQGCVT